MGKGSFLQGFDAYAKTLEDFRVKTTGGGLITLIAAACITVLLVSEFNAYRTLDLKPALVVDKSRKQQLAIHLNITFPRVPCYLLSIDVMDVAGDHQDEVEHNMYKTRLSSEGRPLESSREAINTKNDTSRTLARVADECGSCYGGEPPASGCCQTCEDVRHAYKRRGWSFGDPNKVEQCVREGWSEKIEAQAGEGCNVFGVLELKKVAGNFHIAPGSSFSQGGVHVHDFQPYLTAKFDFSHEIHYLTFGEVFDGFKGSLDGRYNFVDEPNHIFTYFVKVVETIINYRNGKSTRMNQYSVTEYVRKKSTDRMQLPGFFLNYEISPLQVLYKETQPTLGHLVTGVFSIVGGIFTVAGLVDSVLYKAEQTVSRKMQLGKAS